MNHINPRHGFTYVTAHEIVHIVWWLDWCWNPILPKRGSFIYFISITHVNINQTNYNFRGKILQMSFSPSKRAIFRVR